jgi:gamma-D-glutamyl-L-lysine dipeptidyl-peptidase
MRVRYSAVLSVFLLFSCLAALAQLRLVASQPVINMYSEPSLDAEVVSQAIYGVTVNQVTAENAPDGWIRVKTPDDYPGWAIRNSFLPLDPNENYAGTDKRVVTVKTRGANVYREPDVTKHAPLLMLPFEASLEVISVSPQNRGRWLKVRLTSGQEAWVQRGDVQERAGKTLSIEETIALAKKFLGVTYTWGGTSSFGFDCSGFTQMLMRHRGVVMPRDADIQAAWSGVTAVKRSELRAGDLLFFGSSDKHITHTGMYIGNGEFIHDTTHERPMVQISRLDDQPWTRLLVASRRAK